MLNLYPELGVSCDVRDENIGPRHDPYGATTVRLERYGVRAEFYSDGLGRHRARFFAADGALDREIEWWYAGGTENRDTHRANEREVDRLTRERFGTTFDDAQQAYYDGAADDPMGSLAQYA